MTTPIRVLHIVSSTYQGSGVLQVILNWHRNIDRTKVQFDYLCFLPSINSAQEEINQLGGQCYLLPNPTSHPVKFLCESYKFFKTHRYHTVHSHITHLNFFFYPLAKWFGTKNIIQHAHLTKWSDKKMSGLRNYLMLHAVWPLITDKMACSQAAGEAYYGKNFTVVNNGIDLEKFSYNPVIRAQKRKELGVENNSVIGHVGRFNIQKNHKFLIHIFEQVLKKEPMAKLVLVGSGPLEKQIKILVKTKNLQDNVLFLGVRKDLVELYQAFDCFVFPSLHEGLGIVAIEAQTAGLPCVLADTLPQEAFVCNYKKIALGAAKEWAHAIITFTKDFKRTDTSAQVKTAGFSAKEVATQMQEFYSEIM